MHVMTCTPSLTVSRQLHVMTCTLSLAVFLCVVFAGRGGDRIGNRNCSEVSCTVCLSQLWRAFFQSCETKCEMKWFKATYQCSCASHKSYRVLLTARYGQNFYTMDPMQLASTMQ